MRVRSVSAGDKPGELSASVSMRRASSGLFWAIKSSPAFSRCDDRRVASVAAGGFASVAGFVGCDSTRSCSGGAALAVAGGGLIASGFFGVADSGTFTGGDETAAVLELLAGVSFVGVGLPAPIVIVA